MYNKREDGRPSHRWIQQPYETSKHMQQCEIGWSPFFFRDDTASILRREGLGRWLLLLVVTQSKDTTAATRKGRHGTNMAPSGELRNGAQEQIGCTDLAEVLAPNFPDLTRNGPSQDPRKHRKTNNVRLINTVAWQRRRLQATSWQLGIITSAALRHHDVF